MLLSLSCSHTFHDHCMNQYSQVKGLGVWDMPCPVCKRVSSEAVEDGGTVMDSPLPAAGASSSGIARDSDGVPVEDVVGGGSASDAEADGDLPDEGLSDEVLPDEDLPDECAPDNVIEEVIAAASKPKAKAASKPKAKAAGKSKAKRKPKAKAAAVPDLMTELMVLASLPPRARRFPSLPRRP